MSIVPLMMSGTGVPEVNANVIGCCSWQLIPAIEVLVFIFGRRYHVPVAFH